MDKPKKHFTFDDTEFRQGMTVELNSEGMLVTEPLLIARNRGGDKEEIVLRFDTPVEISQLTDALSRLNLKMAEFYHLAMFHVGAEDSEMLKRVIMGALDQSKGVVKEVTLADEDENEVENEDEERESWGAN